jgi:hypothetical protein
MAQRRLCRKEFRTTDRVWRKWCLQMAQPSKRLSPAGQAPICLRELENRDEFSSGDIRAKFHPWLYAAPPFDNTNRASQTTWRPDIFPPRRFPE